MSIRGLLKIEHEMLEGGIVNLDAKLQAMIADRDAWKAKAERYREALEIMSRDESLRWTGFIVRDVARAALQENTP